MKNKILVTGGCGYIGSHTIIEILENSGLEVISVDNNLNSSSATMDRIESITGKQVKNYNVDLCDFEATKEIFEHNPDITGIIHFAALKSVPESVEKPLYYYHNNFESLINILECAKKYNVKNVIFSSSCSVYGNVESLPVDESTPMGKTECAYAHSKKVGEEMIQNFVAASDVKVIALRYFNPVGAHVSGKNGENPINKPNNLVPVITQTAVGIIDKMTVFGDDYDTRDGSCVRDYIHVTDIAKAHVKAVQAQIEGKLSNNFDVINLGSGSGVTVLEAIKSFEKISGLSLNYQIGQRRAGDVEAIYSNIDKATKLLNWKPEFELDEMIESAWKWQQTVLEEA